MTKTLRKGFVAIMLFVMAISISAFSAITMANAEETAVTTPELTNFYEKVDALKADCADTDPATIDVALGKPGFPAKAGAARDKYNNVTDKSSIAAEYSEYYNAVIVGGCEPLFNITDYVTSTLYQKLHPELFEEERLYMTDAARVTATIAAYEALETVNQKAFVDALTNNREFLIAADTKLNAMKVAKENAVNAIAGIKGYNSATKAMEVYSEGTTEIVVASEDSLDAALVALNSIYYNSNGESISFADIVKENDAARNDIPTYDTIYLVLRAKYDALKAEVQAVIDEIGAIEYIAGEKCFTLKTEIEAAKASFDALPGAGDATYGDFNNKQALVSNADLLNNPTTGMIKDLQEAEEAIAAVVEAINNIGDVVQTSACDELIKAAETAFNALDKDIVAHDSAETAPSTYFVSNYKTMIDKRAAYDALVKETNDAVADLKEVAVLNDTEDETFLERVAATNVIYNDLTAEQKIAYDAAVVDPAYKEQSTGAALLAYLNNIVAVATSDAEGFDSDVTNLGEPSITAEFKGKLEAAEAKWKGLSKYAKQIAKKNVDLETARTNYDALLGKANGVIAAIKSLPELNENGGNVAGTFFAMQEIYLTLDVNEKKYVDETVVDPAYKGSLNTCKKVYDYFLNVANKINTQAQEVISKIAAIGDVVYTEDCKGKIDAARTAYDGMTLGATAQAAVNNYDVLVAAEKEYDRIDKAVKGWVAQADNMPAADVIGTEGRNLFEDNAAVGAVQKAYNSLDKKTTDGIALVAEAQKTKFDEAVAKVHNINVAVMNVIKEMNKISIDPLLTDDVAIESFKTEVSDVTALYDALSATVGAQAWVQTFDTTPSMDGDAEPTTDTIYGRYVYAKDTLVGLYNFVKTVNALPAVVDVKYENYDAIKAVETAYTNTLTADQRSIFDENATYTDLKTKYTGDVEAADAIRTKLDDFVKAVNDLLVEDNGAVYIKDVVNETVALFAVDPLENLVTVNYTKMQQLLTEYSEFDGPEQTYVTEAGVLLNNIQTRVMVTVPADLSADMDYAGIGDNATLDVINNIKNRYDALSDEQKLVGDPSVQTKFEGIENLLVKLSFATYFNNAVNQIEANVNAGHFTAEDLVMINTLRSVFGAANGSLQNAVKADYDKLTELANNEGYATIKDYTTVVDEIQTQIDTLKDAIDGLTNTEDITTLQSKVTALEAAKTALEKADTANKAAIDAAVGRLTTAEGKITDLEAAVADNVKAIKDANDALVKAQKDLKDYVDGEVVKLNKAITDLEDKLTKVDTDNKAAIEKALNDAKTALEAADKKNADDILAAVKTANDALVKAQKDLKDYVDGEVVKLNKAIADLEYKLTKADTADKTALQAEISALETKLNDTKTAIEATATADKKVLEDKIAALEEKLTNADKALEERLNKRIDEEVATLNKTIKTLSIVFSIIVVVLIVCIVVLFATKGGKKANN